MSNNSKNQNISYSGGGQQLNHHNNSISIKAMGQLQSRGSNAAIFDCVNCGSIHESWNFL